MPSKPSNPGPLMGQALADASIPLAQTPRGGMEFGFDGTSNGRPGRTQGVVGDIPSTAQENEPQPPQDFTGMGSWLEDDDATVFKTANELVLRQELLAINHLQQDTHYTLVKLGFPFSQLTKDQNRDTYRQTIPTGMSSTSIQAVPNQAWDLVNKATEAVLVDPPQPDPQPLNDSEQAQAAAEMAERFLTEDGGEQGTNDIQLFTDALDAALTRSSSYVEDWVDPVGGGYVPLQILAHPEAVSPDNPLVGPDGMPTPNNVLRYVTAPVGGQFTDDPLQAAPQWQPKLMSTVWGREHWRVFPESVPVEKAEKLIGLLYCTLGEAKRRWPDVAAMSQDDLNALLSWTPPRFLVLLPPFQRARFRLSSGSDSNKSGSSDERIIFYYLILQHAAPDHKRGAEVVVTGAMDGRILFKDTNAVELEVPAEGGEPKQEVRCMDLRVTQLTPRSDPDERDPSGRCYMELFCGATEFNAALATGFLEALNIWLHPDSYIPSTSSVQGFQVEESRVSGDAIPILRKDDMPQYGNMPPIPPNFWDAYDRNDQHIRAIASLDKAVTGQEDQTKESGKALQIAVSRAMVGLARMQRPTNAAIERHRRIKIQLAMKHFSTAQTIRYVGEDGSYKATQWKGTDFALIGNVGTQIGTGTMMAPDQKVNYIATLQAQQLLPNDQAADAARESYAKRLGLTDDPHKQYIERCVTLWLDGPPKDEPAPAEPQIGPDGQPVPSPVPWVQQWQAYRQQKQVYDQSAQAAQLAASQQQAVSDHDAAQGGPAMPVPQPQLGPPPVAPWSPFQPRPNDTEPKIAEMWMTRLSRVISTVKFDAMIPEWRECLVEKYEATRQVVAQSQQPAPPPQAPGKSAPKKQEPLAQGAAA